MKYMDDPQLTWSAVGLLAYLSAHGIDRVGSVDLLGLNRAAYYHHPSDPGDLESAWGVLLACGYVEPCGEEWRVFWDAPEAEAD